MKNVLSEVIKNHKRRIQVPEQRGREGKSVVFTTPDRMIWVQPASWSRWESLFKTFYDDYHCLVASNKQQIQWTRT